MKTLRPFFRFYGGKWRAAPKYPPPTHKVIVEPFAGAAGYSMRYPDHDVVLVDADPKLFGVWDYLIHVTEAEFLSLPILGASDTVNDFGLCDEAKWFLGFWVNNATSQPCLRPSAWARKYPERFWNEVKRQQLSVQLQHIRHWEAYCSDYAAIPNVDATWFIDPPYNNKAGRRYTKQPDSFDALSEWCRERRGQVIVCENSGATWLPFKDLYVGRSAPAHYRPTQSHEAMWYKEQ